ncbi:MAG: broad specificity phosphatase PhoE [Roseivirga sp.]|jgi:2,3-bisphosphoglycerate-dependent phosphoglycerate mutase
MKFSTSLSLVFCLFFLSCSTQGQEVKEEATLTTFVLIRHAEKGIDDPRNPSLNEEGVLRAQKLVELLQHSDVDVIYTTPYKRTQETVAPLASKYSLTVQEYNPSKLAFLNEVWSNNQGKTIVISGHSNTTPMVANYLLGEEKFSQLDESEYDKVFVVTINEIGKGTVSVLSY